MTTGVMPYPRTVANSAFSISTLFISTLKYTKKLTYNPRERGDPAVRAVASGVSRRVGVAIIAFIAKEYTQKLVDMRHFF